jgi:hypothetical protein
MQTKHINITGLRTMGAPSYPSGNPAYNPAMRGITLEELTVFQTLAEGIKNGKAYTPAMMKSITHPYLKQKLMEAICMRQAG